MKTLIIGLIALLMSPLSFAEKDILIPEVGEDTNTGMIPRLRGGGGSIPLLFEVGCYGDNNRHTTNPISPNSTMTSTVKIAGKSYAIKWSSSLTRGSSGTVQQMSSRYDQSMKTFCAAHPEFCEDRVMPVGCVNFNDCTQQVFDDSGVNSVTKFINFSKNLPKSNYGGVNSDRFDAVMSMFYQNLFNTSRLKEGVKWGTIHGDFFKYFSPVCETGTPVQQKQCIVDHGCETVCALGNDASCIGSCRSLSVAAEANAQCTVDGAAALSCEKMIVANIPTGGVEVGNVSISHMQDLGDAGEDKREFYAYNGPSAGRNTIDYMKTGGEITGIVIKSSFPGQDGYCGGYHSPLMLFFGKKYPKFTAKTAFLDDKKRSKTYWPEKNHHGYFLAKLESLKSKDYKVSTASQLFGSNGAFADGFAVLKNHDENQDGVISKKDPIFKLLILWKDKNGDGVSSPDELVSLKSLGVTKFFTDYDSTYHLEFAKRAKARGMSYFEYTDKKGKVKKGTVLDIFFSEIYY